MAKKKILWFKDIDLHEVTCQPHNITESWQHIIYINTVA